MIDHLLRDLQVLRKADILIGKIWLNVLARRLGLFRARNGKCCRLQRAAELDRNSLGAGRGGRGFHDRGYHALVGQTISHVPIARSHRRSHAAARSWDRSRARPNHIR
jgi:hypothetical protein